MISEMLFNNALFIRNWRERMRPHIAGSYVCVVMLVIGLIFLGNYINYISEVDKAKARKSRSGCIGISYEKDVRENKSLHIIKASPDYRKLSRENAIQKYNKPAAPPLPWLNGVIFQLAVVQGIILLLFGTYFSIKIAGLEKLSGTLEFHRCSPASRLTQIIGLVFGPPVLEWCLFLGILLINIIIVITTDIKIGICISFGISLIISAIFFHSLAVLYSLCSDAKRHRAAWIFIALCAFAFLTFKVSCCYHTTPFPAYEDLFSILHNQSQSNDYRNILHLFFGHPVPYLLLQFIIQIPLIILFWMGIGRKFEYGENPVWSKMQSAVFSALVLFYFTGSILTFTGRASDLAAVVIIFWFTAFILVLITALSSTPTYLAFTKGLHRARKMGIGSLPLSDDHSSNWLWIITLCVIITGNFGIIVSYCYHLLIISWKLWAGLLMAGLCYVVFFSSLLEYFNLSKYHQKKSLLVAGLIILWIVFPVFCMILASDKSFPAELQYFVIPSQFYGMVMLTAVIFEDIKDIEMSLSPLTFLTFILILISLHAFIAVLLVLSQRLKLKKILNKLPFICN